MKTPNDSEDNSILSAYLDGELDPEAHQLVESRLATDPLLTDSLRRIREVRDLFSNLPRPRTADLSPGVLAKINRERRGRASRLVGILAEQAGGASAYHLWGGLTLVAASLVIGFLPILSHFGAIPTKSASNRGVFAQSSPPRSGPDRLTSATISDLSPTSKAVEVAKASSIPAISSPSQSTPAVASPSAKPQADPIARSQTVVAQEKARRLLDNPAPRHVFLITDTVGGEVGDRVANLVEQTARSDFFVITVAQGIVLDPRHPSEAKVYALTMTEADLERFRAKANSVLDEPHEEFPASPELVTQLGDIGQVVAFTPPSTGVMVIPREAVAFKTKPQAGTVVSETIRNQYGTIRRQPNMDESRPNERGAAESVANTPSAKSALEKASDDSKPAASESVANRSESHPNVAGISPDTARPVGSPTVDHASKAVLVLVWVKSPRSG